MTSRLVAEMPKVETHLHLDGALSPETVQRLAELVSPSNLRGLPVDEIRRRVVVDRPRATLGEVLAAFNAFYPLLRSAEAVELAAYELIREAARQNVLYAEVRFAPVLQETPHFPASAVLNAALQGLEHGRRDFGVRSGVIICLLRPFAVVSREANERMAMLAIEYAGRGVVGLDVADAGPGDEKLSDYGVWLRQGRDAGLGVTVHAGEAPRGQELEEALALGVDRIGHAVRLRDLPDLLAEVRRRGITIEANLTSNLRTGAVASYREHPIRAWKDAGLAVTISTDDPGVFGIDLTHEYRVLAQDLGFTAAELIEVSRAGIDSLFLPKDERLLLVKHFEQKMNAVLDRLRD